MNELQRAALRAVAFGRVENVGAVPSTVKWLAQKDYITEASWGAEVTQEGYVAGVASGALTPWFALSADLTLEVNTYGAGSVRASAAHLDRFLAALKRGLTDGSLKLVEDGMSGYYRVVARY